MAPFSLGNERGKKNNFLAFRQKHQRIDHVLKRLCLDGFAALVTMGMAAAGKEQAEMIIDFRYRADR